MCVLALKFTLEGAMSLPTTAELHAYPKRRRIQRQMFEAHSFTSLRSPPVDKYQKEIKSVKSKKKTVGHSTHELEDDAVSADVPLVTETSALQHFAMPMCSTKPMCAKNTRASTVKVNVTPAQKKRGRAKKSVDKPNTQNKSEMANIFVDDAVSADVPLVTETSALQHVAMPMCSSKPMCAKNTRASTVKVNVTPAQKKRGRAKKSVDKPNTQNKSEMANIFVDDAVSADVPLVTETSALQHVAMPMCSTKPMCAKNTGASTVKVNVTPAQKKRGRPKKSVDKPNTQNKSEIVTRKKIAKPCAVKMQTNTKNENDCSEIFEKPVSHFHQKRMTKSNSTSLETVSTNDIGQTKCAMSAPTSASCSPNTVKPLLPVPTVVLQRLCNSAYQAKQKISSSDHTSTLSDSTSSCSSSCNTTPSALPKSPRNYDSCSELVRTLGLDLSSSTSTNSVQQSCRSLFLEICKFYNKSKWHEYFFNWKDESNEDERSNEPSSDETLRMVQNRIIPLCTNCGSNTNENSSSVDLSVPISDKSYAAQRKLDDRTAVDAEMKQNDEKLERVSQNKVTSMTLSQTQDKVQSTSSEANITLTVNSSKFIKDTSSVQKPAHSNIKDMRTGSNSPDINAVTPLTSTSENETSQRSKHAKRSYEGASHDLKSKNFKKCNGKDLHENLLDKDDDEDELDGDYLSIYAESFGAHIDAIEKETSPSRLPETFKRPSNPNPFPNTEPCGPKVKEKIILRETDSAETELASSMFVCETQNADSASLLNTKPPSNVTETVSDKSKSGDDPCSGLVPRNPNRPLIYGDFNSPPTFMFHEKKFTSWHFKNVCRAFLVSNCMDSSCRNVHIPLHNHVSAIRENPKLYSACFFAMEYMTARKYFFRLPCFQSYIDMFMEFCIEKQWYRFLLEIVKDALIVIKNPERIVHKALHSLDSATLHDLRDCSDLLGYRLTGSGSRLIHILLSIISKSHNLMNYKEVLVNFLFILFDNYENVQNKTAVAIVEKVCSLPVDNALLRVAFNWVIKNTSEAIFSNQQSMERFGKLLFEASKEIVSFRPLCRSFENMMLTYKNQNQSCRSNSFNISSPPAENLFGYAGVQDHSSAKRNNELQRYTSPDTTQYHDIACNTITGQKLYTRRQPNTVQSGPRHSVFNAQRQTVTVPVRQPSGPPSRWSLPPPFLRPITPQRPTALRPPPWQWEPRPAYQHRPYF